MDTCIYIDVLHIDMYNNILHIDTYMYNDILHVTCNHILHIDRCIYNNNVLYYDAPYVIFSMDGPIVMTKKK